MGKKKIWRMLEDTLIRASKEVVKVFPYPDGCKFCGSKRIVRYGHSKHIQRWWCKDCQRKFVDNDALPRMKTPIIQVASALSMFYEGMSLHGIRRNFEQTYKSYPSNSTIYYWVVRFTKEAIGKAKDCKPSVGDVWIADETILKIEGKNLWFWDIIDDETRFLLASHISLSRTTRDAKALVERASERAGKTPKVIITDKLQAYLDGIELAFGADTKHIPRKGLATKPDINLIERFHGTLKARTKVMRGLKKRETAKLITDGWLIHYNFFRPHEALGEKTPAEKAGIKFPFRNWLDVVKGAKND
jgi:transposase-like protein/ribosomal protein L37AE/L43A